MNHQSILFLVLFSLLAVFANLIDCSPDTVRLFFSSFQSCTAVLHIDLDPGLSTSVFAPLLMGWEGFLLKQRIRRSEVGKSRTLEQRDPPRCTGSHRCWAQRSLRSDTGAHVVSSPFKQRWVFFQWVWQRKAIDQVWELGMCVGHWRIDAVGLYPEPSSICPKVLCLPVIGGTYTYLGQGWTLVSFLYANLLGHSGLFSTAIPSPLW